MPDRLKTFPSIPCKSTTSTTSTTTIDFTAVSGVVDVEEVADRRSWLMALLSLPGIKDGAQPARGMRPSTRHHTELAWSQETHSRGPARPTAKVAVRLAHFPADYRGFRETSIQN